MKNNKTIIRYMLKCMMVIFSTLLLLSSCSNIFGNIGPLAVPIVTNSFILSWESGNSTLPGISSATEYFNIFYRDLYSKRTIFLEKTPDAECTKTFEVSELIGSGKYELGVQYVCKNGKTSEIHWSTDFDAKPAGGWYISINP